MQPSIIQHTPQQMRVEYATRRHCDEHDITSPEEQARVFAFMRHREFMRDTERLRDMRNRLAETQLNLLTPGYIQHEDGRLERMEVPMPPELVTLLQQFDAQIGAVAASYGLLWLQS